MSVGVAVGVGVAVSVGVEVAVGVGVGGGGGGGRGQAGVSQSELDGVSESVGGCGCERAWTGRGGSGRASERAGDSPPPFFVPTCHIRRFCTSSLKEILRAAIGCVLAGW